MKFTELNPDAQAHAMRALADLIVRRSGEGVSDCENLGRCVAAAFIAMERFDGAPDECGD
ncbi:hypothetical protein TUM12370_17810 [Salmonella enterica subsp. enterica serovar Choleraesuis]|nr:hypothetical protein TUM12370_17810 [Salmonella enterica subsp. enterica serovar Choleraesuis]